MILASQSPRRKELLRGLEIPFTIQTLDDIDESYPATLSKEEVALHICQKKAEAYRALLTPDAIIITADTIVAIDDRILGKPHDRAEAQAMLRSLSGRMHQVYTAVSITTAQQCRSFIAETKVYFATLSDEEIAYYLDQHKPYDKAGSYGVQEWIGYVAVERMEGSYFNVMGLPIHRLYRELLQIAAP